MGTMRHRDFLGVLIAFLADSAQLGITVVSFGASQIAIPVQVVFTVVVSAILALLMGSNMRLLFGAAIDIIPILNLGPGLTFGALWTAHNNAKKRKEIKLKKKAEEDLRKKEEKEKRKKENKERRKERRKQLFSVSGINQKATAALRSARGGWRGSPRIAFFRRLRERKENIESLKEDKLVK